MAAEGFTTEGTYSPDNLFAGDYPVVSTKLTLVTGESVVRGEVLGVITASGKLAASLSAAVDGSQVPHCIAVEAVDATAADKEILVYLSGHFNASALTIGTAHTAASIREGLREKGIYI